MLYQEAAEGPVLGSVPFHVYMQDLKLAVKCLPVKFTEDPKLEDQYSSMLKVWGGLEEWTSRNLKIQALLWPHSALTGEEAWGWPRPLSQARMKLGQAGSGGEVPWGPLPPKWKILLCCYVAIFEARPVPDLSTPFPVLGELSQPLHFFKFGK